MIDPQRKQAIKDGLTAFGLAIAVHLGFVLVLLFGTWDWQPFEHRPVPVRVTLVDQGPTMVEQPEAVEEAVDEAERQREEELERQRQEELEQQRQEEEAERQRQAELEQQRQEEAERRRLEEAEAARRREAERERLRQAEEERRQAEAERQRELEELRRQREAAQREREEQERRLQELAERRERQEEEQAAEEEAERLRLAQEEAAADARRATLGEEYTSTIRELVRRNWIRPPTTAPGVRCDIRVMQIPGGEIIDATVVSPCNADEATRRSITAAVLRVGTLPYRGYEDVFAREIVFTFVYDG
ncbi:cell envelope integrity protein TolA [Wenzhouxiangella sp. XN201]|uniref:cell envelope integrity protein TolA n=1 Tax=Wenzhouxiangella sp. XN201 TaxID=2710755 RepID=UPI0013C99D6F|nr:cell envelope integrity protein TolA [Wenzhouxiangella sp. XN201]NEZ04607.1 cell envelope integrity protein TolA [Wenzhouxiangella sp. XN201]